MSRHAPHADVEEALVEFFTSLGRGSVGTYTPGDLQKVTADGTFFIRVGRVGGGDSRNGAVDEPRVTVQVFGSRSSIEPRRLHDHAALLRADLLNLPAVTSAGRLDAATTESGPVNMPWVDPSVAAVQMIFRLSTRR